MKRLFFITILIFCFCFAALAQADKSSCKEIKIEAPESVRPGEIFSVSASYKDKKESDISTFNWFVIGDNAKEKEKAFRMRNKKSIKINPINFEGDGTITILVEPFDKECQKVVLKNIFVITGGHPFTIDEYDTIDWTEERIRLDNILVTMQRLENTELFAFFDFEKKTPPKERVKYLTKVFEQLTKTRGFPKSRITFLISESDERRIWYQPIPQDHANIYPYGDYLKIRGEDLEKTINLFQQK